MFPNHIKTLITITLLIGIMLGSILSFKSKNYIKIGEASISLWFIHFLTTKPASTLSPTINILMKNDKY